MPTRLIQLLLAILSPLVYSVGFSQELAISPERQPGQSWEVALKSQLQRSGQKFIDPESALAVAVEFDEVESEPRAIGGVPEWRNGIGALHSLNTSARTTRRYTNPNPGNYQRKAAWLYPNDGCYAKAAHVSAVASNNGYIRPGKVFAYGNLKFNSQYASNGRGTVYWSYHVVAAYYIGSTVYVLDPMVNSSSAITVSQWLSRISTQPSSIRVSYCDSKAYSPSSRCIGSKGNGAYLGHMPGILRTEYNNLRRLGFNAQALLGPARDVEEEEEAEIEEPVVEDPGVDE